ncbi:cache domain-containing protein [candidate division WOR-3 bacterium]|nr:cache domain-containing protein [candidate division WOR-3 bacterium]
MAARCGIVSIIIGLLFLYACVTEKALDKPVYEYEETIKLVAFVNSATDLIEKDGEECFPEFRIKDSKWQHDDMYIFVWGLDGMRYVYPPDPEGEGENMLDLKDIDGKPIGKMIVRAVSGEKEEGWVHCEWPKPGEETPTWKSTYLKRAKAPSGKVYLVGSGLYNMKCERLFIVNAVDNAIKLLKDKGLAAIEEMRSSASEFIFLDSYVFIKDMKGDEILNPAFPDLEGQNLYDLQDSNGKYFIREELELLQTQDECWMEYMWPKPGETEPSRKMVYVKKIEIDGRVLIVGAGYFP